MRCAFCQHESPSGSTTCEGCGETFGKSCGTCGSTLTGNARFCSQCGMPVPGAPPPLALVPDESTAADGPAPSYNDGERRQITAMFCDIVDYTRLSHELDPEDLQRSLADYQRACAKAIKHYGGHVAQFLGDGVLAYFGYPSAHEDDAERAVRAGIDIRTAMADLNQRRADAGVSQMAVRIGIHTGPVLVTAVGDGARQETLALGETITIANRLEAIAPAGAVVISDNTLRLVRGLFVTRELGNPSLKGISQPVGAHLVVGSAGVGARFAGPGAGELTPLTGRGELVGRFLSDWQEVEEGHGKVLALSGESGIGKSRLLHAFRQQLESTPHFALMLACSPYTTGSAFHPVIELYEVALNFGAGDSREEKLARMEDGLAAIPGLRLEETLPYLAALLGLPESECYPLEHMSPEVQREKTLEALLAPLIALEARQPLLVAIEDLHWCDPSTLDLLERLIERTPSLRMLVALTHRPEFDQPWLLESSDISHHTLSRLSKRNTRSIIETAIGHQHILPDNVLDVIVERSEGIPLFAEELAHSIIDSGMIQEHEGRTQFRGRIEDLTIPSTLQDSLMARLDRLTAAKPVAQLAATLGREFPYALIEALSDLDADTLDHGLEELVAAQVLYRTGDPPDSRYIFKHALLHDTAYESQLKSRRRALHARAAAILEEQFPQRIEAEPELMARHCAAGGLTERAIECFKQAGSQAVNRLASHEAIEYFNRALELLETLTEDDDRHQKEIELLLALNGPLTGVRGYSDPESVATRERIEILCDAIGRGPQQLPALIGLTLHHVNRGHLPAAKEYAEALLDIAAPLGVKSLEVAGHMIRGAASITTTTVHEARESFERAIKIAQSTDLPPPSAAFDVDPLTMAYCVNGIALVTSGLPESGIRSAEMGLQRARKFGHARTYGSALVNAATARYFMDDVESNLKFTEECLQVVNGRGFHSVECSASVQAGWARVRLGDDGGVSAIEEALRQAESSGALGGLSQLYFIAAEAYLLVGRLDDAEETLDQGARIIERTGEWMGFGPQVLAVRARILAEIGNESPKVIEQLLLEAIDGWKRNGQRLLELVSALQLGRLALRTDKRIDAHTRLRFLYDGFTEGFDTPLLREARDLIDQLA
jgi:class 3 adenylate cyclase/tetratricopeptide (TPR) repeat protein